MANRCEAVSVPCQVGTPAGKQRIVMHCMQLGRSKRLKTAAASSAPPSCGGRSWHCKASRQQHRQADFSAAGAAFDNMSNSSM
jgi:hypothetical protein